MITKNSLMGKYSQIRRRAESRTAFFERVGKKGGNGLFEELVFCILTPQSKARSCDRAVLELKASGLLYNGNRRQIAKMLSKGVRFHNNKAEYVVEAREKLSGNGFSRLFELTFEGDEKEARERLVGEVRGIGLKEASHYLRNVGRGKKIAILDRHILKNLCSCKVIACVPKSLTAKKYFEIEKKMEAFSKKSRVPMPHLDFVFWSEETGEIFK